MTRSNMTDELHSGLKGDFQNWLNSCNSSGDIIADLEEAFMQGSEAIGCFCTDYHVCGFCDA
jgi:hypothetical protein